MSLLQKGYLSIQEWGKSFIFIESAVCAGLWPKLIPSTEFTLHGLDVHWINCSFCYYVELRFILYSTGSPVSSGSWFRLLVLVQFAFFLAGLICFGTHMFDLWFGA